MFADASQEYWGFMLTQCTNCNPADSDDEKPIQEQVHKPVFFMSGKFTASQLQWHISQKEIYPLIYSFKRIPYIMFGHTHVITVFTDHKNLHQDWNPKTAYIDRLIRWGLLIQQADICVRHIPGELDVVADILSRWGNQFSQDKPISRKGEPNVEEIDAKTLQFVPQLLSTKSFTFENAEISPFNPWYVGSWKQVTKKEIEEEQQRLQLPSTIAEKLLIPNSILT